jgi:hypothetical protein
MDNSKKTILIMIIPAMLTLYFIARVLFPAIETYRDTKSKFLQTSQTCQQEQAKLDELKDNKILLDELKELNAQVADFEIQTPAEFFDEFFLTDLGKFAINTGTRVISLNSKEEKEFEVKPVEKQKKKNKRSKKTEVKPLNPLSIYQKPFEIKAEAHYNQAIAFVENLEDYQRKFIISGISAQIAKSDEKNPNPKIELTIEGSTFKAINSVTSEEIE